MSNRAEQGGGSGLGSLIGSVAAKTAKKVARTHSVSSSAHSSRRSSRSGIGYTVGRTAGRVVHGSGGGGGSSHSSHSSGGGGGGTVRKTVSPPKPKVPSVNAYLGTDSGFQDALRGGKSSLANFLADLNRRRGEATTQFNQTTQSMGRDRTQQLADLRDEFASRGLIQSGLYADQVGQFNQKFTDQQNTLKQQQTGLLSDLLSQQNNYQRENTLAMNQARQDAILRRAQKFNIG
jgi:hypothetical protein